MGLWKAKQMARNQGVRYLLLYYLLMEEIHRQSITPEVAVNIAGQPTTMFSSWCAKNFRCGLFVTSENNEY